MIPEPLQHTFMEFHIGTVYQFVDYYQILVIIRQQ